MARLLSSWERRLVDGGELHVAPAGARAGVITLSRDVRPLVGIGELVERRLAAENALVVEELAGPEPCVTDEGEHAATVTLRATLDGQPVWRLIGVVFGDEACTVLDGVVAEPTEALAFARRFQQALREVRLDLGRRPRRYRFEAPGGWRLLEQGLAQRWLPPDRADTSIDVLPALPRPGTQGEVIAALLAADRRRGLALRHVREPAPFATLDGLSGELVEIVSADGDGEVYRTLALLDDERFLYCLLFTARALAHRGADATQFRQLLATVRPVPMPGCVAGADELFEHWAP